MTEVFKTLRAIKGRQTPKTEVIDNLEEDSEEDAALEASWCFSQRR